jgi:hypothetical protein
MRESRGKLGVHWRFDPSECNGAVALSALTLLRERGRQALDHALLMNRRKNQPKQLTSDWEDISNMIEKLIGR